MKGNIETRVLLDDRLYAIPSPFPDVLEDRCGEDPCIDFTGGCDLFATAAVKTPYLGEDGEKRPIFWSEMLRQVLSDFTR